MADSKLHAYVGIAAVCALLGFLSVPVEHNLMNFTATRHRITVPKSFNSLQTTQMASFPLSAESASKLIQISSKPQAPTLTLTATSLFASISLATAALAAFTLTKLRQRSIPLSELPPVHVFQNGMVMAATAAVEEPPMLEAASGVLFDSIAREWRCKWETEEGLSACQRTLDKYLPQIKALDGVEVQRTVCGGCKDFKVVITLKHPGFGDWQAISFAPEAAFLADLKAIPGVNHVEAQTYSFQTIEPPKVKEDKKQEIVPGVRFNRIAREWRCKWSEDKNSASLVEAQQVIDELLPLLRSLPGAQVQRVVCGGCKDLKVITSVPASIFDAWKDKRFKPEENFLNEVTSIRGISQVEVQTYTLQSLSGPVPAATGPLNEKAKGVYYNRVAREWRCKWSKDNDSASLVAAQKVLDQYLPKLKAIEGSHVQRVVCGGCLDFKVVTSVPSDRFGAWQDGEFDPEHAFLRELKAIPGITQVETQTYTLQPLDGTVVDAPLQEKAPGILFSRVAREWRCKFSPDNNRASLVAAQKVLDAYLSMLTARTGARVQRAVCTEGNQLKVVTSVPTSEFSGWKDEDFPPEEEFLATLQRIDGISDVETQTYTFQTL
eukprot:EG_transcript_6501